MLCGIGKKGKRKEGKQLGPLSGIHGAELLGAHVNCLFEGGGNGF